MTQLIPLNDIHFGDRQRKEYPDIPELAESLKNVGQIQAIVVRHPNEGEDTDGRPWVLVVGGRRYTAAAHGGIPELKADILDELPLWRQQLVELEENLQRANLTFVEQVEAKARIHALFSGQAELEGKTWTQQDTARELKETPANVSRDLKLHAAMIEDPTIKSAPSKKAAVRIVDMREHAKRVMRQSEVIATYGRAPLEDRVRTQDARDFLRQLAPQSVDLCFTDLPFGLEDAANDVSYNNNATSAYDDSREVTLDLIADIVPHMLRAMKPTGWLALMMNWELHFELRSFIEGCCVEHFEYAPEAGVPMKEHELCAWAIREKEVCACRFLTCEPIPWVWVRPNSNNNVQWPDRHAMNAYELILVCNMGQARLHTSATESRIPNALIYETNYSNRLHSMEKPPALCEEIVRRLSLPGTLVVDFCHGSGSALVAAAKLGRDFRGCDTNPLLHEPVLARIAEVWKGTAPTTGDVGRGPDGENPSDLPDEGATSLGTSGDELDEEYDGDGESDDDEFGALEFDSEAEYVADDE